MNNILKIEKKYKFTVPCEYIDLYEKGRLTLGRPSHYAELINTEYLWLNELEWIHPSKILSFDCDKQIKEKFVPFAFNGAGELWCWAENEQSGNNTPVVLCDNIREGTFEAPNFISIIFKQILQLAEEGTNKVYGAYLQRYLKEFKGVFNNEFYSEILYLSKNIQKGMEEQQSPLMV